MNTTVFAYAKINLWLRIFPPDTSGFHPLDTLFCALDLADKIVIDTSHNALHLTVAGADVGPTEDNLAMRAAQEFFGTLEMLPRAAIHLTKNIPAGAGLGGGSSDAAAVLRALNHFHDDLVPAADLMAMAARIGSDVPFFLCGSSLARGTGRGEVLQGLAPLPSAPAIVVAPSFPIATADAYRWLDERSAYSAPDDVDPATLRTWADVAVHVHNSFEPVLFEQYSELESIRDALRATGAIIASLSGSGSALFGIYDSADTRERAAHVLTDQFADATILRTGTAG